LQRQVQLADFVQEDRPAVGQLEAPLARTDGVGEGALLVAEEFGLQKLARNGPQLMGTKGLSARLLLVCRARTRSFLARARFAGYNTVLSVGATLARTLKRPAARGSGR
jgi:hypothetical protein